MSTATETSPSPATHWDVADDIYYADAPNSISNSERKDFAESPQLYYGRHVLKIPSWQFSETPQVKFGSAVHKAVFFGIDKLTRIPEDVLSSSGSRSGKRWESFRDEHFFGTLVSPDEHESVKRIIDSIHSHKLANILIYGEFADSVVETAARWTCQDTGLVRRCKFDRLCPGACIVDLKTFGKIPTARNWSARVHEYQYDNQGAYYQDGSEALGMGRLDFVFVVVQTAPPFACECFDLGDDGTGKRWLETARMANEHDLRAFKQAKESGIWQRDAFGQVITIDAPQWAKYERDWNYNGD